MQTPEEVAAMLRLKSVGWGIRRIAREFGCSHMTVRRYVAEGVWVTHRGRGRPRTLAGHEEWLAACLAAAGRFWRAPGADWGREREGILVRCDLGLFPPSACAGVS